MNRKRVNTQDVIFLACYLLSFNMGLSRINPPQQKIIMRFVIINAS